MSKGDPSVGLGSARYFYCEGDDCGKVWEWADVDRSDLEPRVVRELVEVE
jgi:hypothetical protein